MANKHDDRIANLENLVDELIKKSPHVTRIKSLMRTAGIPYANDPSECMRRVVAAIQDAHIDLKKRGEIDAENF